MHIFGANKSFCVILQYEKPANINDKFDIFFILTRCLTLLNVNWYSMYLIQINLCLNKSISFLKQAHAIYRDFKYLNI